MKTTYDKADSRGTSAVQEEWTGKEPPANTVASCGAKGLKTKAVAEKTTGTGPTGIEDLRRVKKTLKAMGGMTSAKVTKTKKRTTTTRTKGKRTRTGQ